MVKTVMRLLCLVSLLLLTSCSGYVQETTNSPLFRELARLSNAIEETIADNALTYNEKDQKLKTYYQQGLSLLDSREGQAAFLVDTDYKAFVEPLFDNLIAFYAEANRPHEGTFVVGYARQVMREESRFQDYFKYTEVLLDLAIGAGRTEQCRGIVADAEDFYQRSFSWLDVNENTANQDMDIKILLLTLRDMRLRCDIAAQKYDNSQVSLYRDYWQDVQSLYRQNDLLPFRFLAQDTFKIIYTKFDRQYRPKNTRYLETLFNYFYEARDIESAESVATTLLEWYDRTTSLSPDNADARFIYSSGVAFYASQTANDRAQLRFERFIKRYQLSAATIPLKLAELAGNQRRFIPLMRDLESTWQRVNEFYRDLDPVVARADNIGRLRFDILMLRGQVFEQLADFQQALNSYEDAVAVAEQWRDSIPVEERREFFRSFAKNAYLGAYRAQAELTVQKPGDEALFERLIAAGERLRSRQLREMLGAEAGQVSSPDEMQYRNLGRGRGVYVVSDLGTKILTQSADRAGRRLSLIDKPSDWGNRIETLRRSVVDASPIDYGTLESLSKDLFDGHADFIRRNESIQVVVDGRLSRLPFSLFRFDGVPLGVAKNIRYLPSLAVLKGGDTESGSRLSSMFAVADPAFAMNQSVQALDEFAASSRGRQRSAGAYFEPLPETRDEVETIIGLVGSDNRALYGADATESKLFEADLTGVKILHFATHGVLGGEVPGLSEPALVLTPEGSDDGLLTASEIQGLKLDAELVVLSACNTGSGEYYFGESVAGLGRAFALAGAKNIVVSLWPVDSLATKRLMVELYSRLVAGKGLDEALKESTSVIYKDDSLPGSATRGLKRVAAGGGSAEGSHPYYWAPFIVMSL